MRIFIVLVLLFGFACQAGEESAYIFEMSAEKPMDEVYQNLYKSLEDSRFYVIFEANIGKNLATNAERWGEDYNRNKFESVRSMVICNPFYANQILNLDPKMIAVCPMTVALIHKQGKTTVLFERLTPIATGSPAEDVLWEVENTIISVIEGVM
ncbi:MAG: DUF302 domain-containing protein [Gammaproteobacteria bacterium]|nr:DUF302 domain-containing protein [Gammaproteobacteria bacterium]